MRIVWLALVAVGCSREPIMIHHRIVAHRGASFEAPGNTLAAFRRAWELGAEAVELDVRLSKDGHVVVFHDATTKRIGAERAVAEQSLAELRTLDANIPTLAEALAIMPAGRTTHVEIKSGPETAPAIARVIRAATPRGAHVVLQGYDAAALGALARELPGATAFWDIDPPKDQPYPLTIVDDAKRHGFGGLALDVRGVTDELVVAARAANILVDIWTLNDRALIQHWLARDVRWIETDRPDLAP